jgi:3-deoxy-D-manno-octulosonic-acid transferase
MSQLIYTIFLFLYSVGMRLAALWNPKARLWLAGRKGNYNKTLAGINIVQSTVVWMHCASLGEFEQGRPLLEAIKQNHPTVKIVLSFFSPSGYEVCKNTTAADVVLYLPMDNPFAARQFVAAVNPALVIWVKYEYWFYFLQELKQRKIPVILVSGIFRSSQPFFKWYGGIWKQILSCFNHLFVQNEKSAQLLNNIGIHNCSVSGDTRFDRVITLAQKPFANNIVNSFCGNSKVIVAGSTWEDDEIILSAYADETHHTYKLIVVPHELDKAHLDEVKKLFKQSICYTAVEKDAALMQNIADYNVLIIDTMGMLSRLYSLGHINYVGGGFTNDGIHNILEAAVWGKPVIIGENYEKYIEAIDLVKLEAAVSISDTNELVEVIKEWDADETYYAASATAAKKYVMEKAGATEKISGYINTILAV